MYAVKVQINDQLPVTGGADDLSVLSAILTLTGKLGATSHPRRDNGSVDFTFRLGGLTARGPGIQDQHLVWLEQDELKVGDRLSIEILETEQPDPVESGSDADERARDERSYYEHCKRAYFELRKKFEPDA
ncbi:hypothetical protein [Piscinibacter terrae]|uniref:Uncharacterized protein n=1 Tax=Piscinibacter terrae TaxID=2496871 RepID=A0A3N7HKR9_9BURK|nr:hypothetical protein [Albitalea terrae]RQP22687.1 hypothetical protein DZC73_20495 [Albitalea terrae]